MKTRPSESVVSRYDSIVTELAGFFESYWLLLLIVMAGGVELVGFLRIYFLLDWPRMLADSALFQHGGWYIVDGGIPYVDFWDIKPPLIYFTTALFALLSGGDMYLLHVLSSLVGAISLTAAVVLVAVVMDDLANDHLVGFAAGVSMLVLTPLYLSPMLGVRAKYFHVTFGLLAIYLNVRNRPFWAGVAGTIAVGYYLSAGVYLLASLGLAFQYGGRRSLVRELGGIAITSGLILLPFVWWGAVTPLFVETVLTLFLTSMSSPLPGHLGELVVAFGPGVLLLGVAVVGWYRGWQTAKAKTWWILSGGTFFLVKALFVDLESWADLVGFMPFMALGIGLFAVTRLPRERVAIGIGLCFLVTGGILWTFLLADPASATLPANDVPAVDTSSNPTDTQGMVAIYWGKEKPETCHYRLSLREKQWIGSTNAEYDDTRCGRWPKRVS